MKVFTAVDPAADIAEEKDVMLRVMTLDLRDRPTARQLLDDERFNQH